MCDFEYFVGAQVEKGNYVCLWEKIKNRFFTILEPIFLGEERVFLSQ